MASPNFWFFFHFSLFVASIISTHAVGFLLRDWSFRLSPKGSSCLGIIGILHFSVVLYGGSPGRWTRRAWSEKQTWNCVCISDSIAVSCHLIKRLAGRIRQGVPVVTRSIEYFQSWWSHRVLLFVVVIANRHKKKYPSPFSTFFVASVVSTDGCPIPPFSHLTDSLSVGLLGETSKKWEKRGSHQSSFGQSSSKMTLLCHQFNGDKKRGEKNTKRNLGLLNLINKFRYFEGWKKNEWRRSIVGRNASQRKKLSVTFLSSEWRKKKVDPTKKWHLFLSENSQTDVVDPWM